MKNITLRIDETLQKEAEDLFSDLGMSLSTAFNIFLRQSVREQRIPFSVERPIPNKETIVAIEDADNGNTEGPFDSVEELMEALNA